MALADKHIALLSDDSDASLDDDEKYEDREALTRCRQALGLSINYVRTWSPRDGFREFFRTGLCLSLMSRPLSTVCKAKHYSVVQEGCDHRDLWARATAVSPRHHGQQRSICCGGSSSRYG